MRDKSWPIKKKDFSGEKKTGAELKQKNKIFWAKYPQKWKNRSRTPKIPPFHCVSEANAWASAHALSMAIWHHHNIVNDYHLITFTHLFKAESAINDFILSSELSQNYLFFLFSQGNSQTYSQGNKKTSWGSEEPSSAQAGTGLYSN